MPSDLSVLLVGFGLAGRVFHAPLITATAGLSLAGIVTSDPERSGDARAKYPEAVVLGSLDAADMSDFDIVVVATANSTHVAYAEAALRAGAHVVLDKPVAAHASQAQKLDELAHELGRLVVPFHNRRWDSDFLTAMQVKATGVLGDVHRFVSSIDRMRVVPKPGWRGSPDPADLGGLLYDLGPHLIDQALLLMGPAIQVSATVRSVRPMDETDDDVIVLITHESGGISLLTASQVSAFAEPRMTVLGTRGGLRIPRPDSQEDVLRTGVVPSTGWGIEPDDHAAELRWYEADDTVAYERRSVVPGRWPDFYAQLEAAVRGRASVPVTMRDAIATLAVMDAARESSASGRAVQVVAHESRGRRNG